jgi:hypothetical protein
MTTSVTITQRRSRPGEAPDRRYHVWATEVRACVRGRRGAASPWVVRWVIEGCYLPWTGSGGTPVTAQSPRPRSLGCPPPCGGAVSVAADSGRAKGCTLSAAQRGLEKELTPNSRWAIRPTYKTRLQANLGAASDNIVLSDA